MDMSKFDPTRFYPEEEIQPMVDALREERRRYLESFKGLKPEIAAAGIF